MFAVVGRAGVSWNPTFRLLDLGRTGADGVVFASHPRAASWSAGDGPEPSIYLLDIATQDHLAGKLDEVVQAILSNYPLPSDIR